MTVNKESYKADAWEFEIDWTVDGSDDSEVYVTTYGPLDIDEAEDFARTLLAKITGEEE